MDKFLSIPVLVFFPMLISFFIISPLFTNNEISVRRFTKTVLSLHFIYSVLMLVFYSSSNPYEANINFFGLNWIQSMGINFSFKIDNIGIILTTLCCLFGRRTPKMKS